MPTEKQIEANRRNALLSTGPRTPEGRAASRLNAYKHGLTGQLEVMTQEQKADRDAFIDGITSDLKPVGALESQLAHAYADAQWRINRVSVIENNLFAAGAWNQESELVEEDPAAAQIEQALASARTFVRNPERFHLLAVYETRLHRKAQADLRQLHTIQTARRAEAEKQQAEKKAAEEKQKAADEARRAAALQESVWLLNLDEDDGDDIDPDGEFQHPNGFVFSTEEIADSRRIAWGRALFENELKRMN